MTSETRLKIASSLREGAKELAQKWAREIAPLYESVGATIDEIAQKNRIGIEALASLLEGTDISSFSNFIRKLSLEWISRGGNIDELRELKSRFLAICENRFSFLGNDDEIADKYITELDYFLENELIPRVAVEYLAIYEMEIGDKCRSLPDSNETLNRMLKLTTRLCGIVDTTDIWEDILAEMREIFPTIDAGVVFLMKRGKLHPAAIVGFEDFLVIKNCHDVDLSLYESMARRRGISITLKSSLDIPARLVFHRRHMKGENVEREYPEQILSFPLMENDKLIGVFSVFTFRKGKFLDDNEIELMEILISHLKNALSRSAIIEDLKGRRRDGEWLLDMERRITGHKKTDELIVAFLDGISNYLGDIRSVVYLTDLNSESLYPIAWRKTISEPGESNISSLYTFALERKVPIYLSSVKENPVLEGITPPSELITLDDCGSLAIIPLISENQILGLWGISTPGEPDIVDGRRFFLTMAANSLAHKLKDILAYITISDEHEKRGKEINLAASLQQYLVPRYYRGWGYEAEVLLEAGGELAGDFAFLESPREKEIIIAIGDVSGRGIAAGLSMMTAYGLLSELSKTTSTSSAILSRLNNRLREHYDKAPSPFHDEAFVTCFLIYAKEDGTVGYSKAGHHEPLILRNSAGDIETFETRGMPLGIFANSVFEEHETSLDHGDIMVLYTDGITESFNDEREEFGVERINEVLKRYRDYPPRVIVNMIKYNLLRFMSPDSESDDRTLIVIKRLEDGWKEFEIPTDDSKRSEAIKLVSTMFQKSKAKEIKSELDHMLNESVSIASTHKQANVGMRIFLSDIKIHVVVNDLDSSLMGIDYPSYDKTTEKKIPQSRHALALLRNHVDFIWYNEHARELNIFKMFGDTLE